MPEELKAWRYQVGQLGFGILDDTVVDKVKNMMAHSDKVIRIRLSGMNISISRELATALYLDEGYMRRGNEQLKIV